MADASEDYEGVGKSVEVINPNSNPMIAGLHTYLLRDTDENFTDGFRAYISEGSLVKTAFQRLQTGMKVFGVSKANLVTIPIPVPTKPEQRAIAQTLQDVDQLLQALEQRLAKKEAIKRGVMQRLLTPGEEWKEYRLGDLGNTFGGLTGKSKKDFSDGNAQYIPFMNVMSNPVIDLEYLDEVKISDSDHQNTGQRGDLFFNTSSETPEEVGMCSVLLEDVSNLYLNSFCFGFRFRELGDFDGLFMAHYFRSSYGRELMYSLAQGATRYNLSKTNFLNLNIELPSFEKQTKIATILTDLDTELDRLRDRLHKYQQLKRGLMQQLLTGKIRLV